MITKQFWGLSFFVAIVLIYVIIFYSFTRLPQKKVTEIYFADRMTEAHHLLIDRYNVAHAGSVKVIPIDFPNADFDTDSRKEILARSLRGEDDAIDLLAVDVIWVHRFAKWCEPLGKYFSEEELKRLNQTVLRTCYHDGELVAIPFDLVQGVMYYREDILKRLPGGNRAIELLNHYITWNDFLNLQKKINWNGPFYIYPAADCEGLICSYIEILLSLRSNYFESTGFRFDTPEAKKALQLLVDLVHTYRATPQVVSDFTEIPSYEYFIRNDGLFIRGWTSYDKDFKKTPYDSVKEKHLRRAPIPYFSEGKPTSLFGGWNLMVSKASTKKDAIIDFLKFLLSDESQELIYSQGGFYPVINSFYFDSTYLQRYPEIQINKDLMKYGVHRPVQENYTKYSKIMARYFYLAIKGNMSVDEALHRVHASIESEKNLLSGK